MIDIMALARNPTSAVRLMLDNSIGGAPEGGGVASNESRQPGRLHFDSHAHKSVTKKGPRLERSIDTQRVIIVKALWIKYLTLPDLGI